MKNIALLLALAIPLVSCRDDASELSQSKGFIVDPGFAWPGNTIPVCWENGNFSTFLYQQTIRAAVESSYNFLTNVKFTGWGPCMSSAGLHIELIGGGPTPYYREPNEFDGHPRVKGAYGRELDGRQPGLILNPYLSNLRPGLQAVANSLNEFEKANLHVSIALHEFGHVLGLMHEQRRPDSACQGFEDSHWDGGYAVGEDDSESVMNYCHTHDSLYASPLFLSAGDIEAVNTLYP